MRLGVATVAICLCVVGISAAQNAAAAMNRRPTNIPAQPLSTALEALAKEHGLQVIYRSEIVQSIQSAGAVGVFTPDEALTRLLAGTGLTFRYLNDTTVTITPASTGASGAPPAQPSSAPPPTSDSKKEPANGAAFLLAQAASGQASSPAAVAGEPASPPPQAVGFVQEVVVTAQKRAERLQDVPISISVLTGKELDQSTAPGITEVLNRVPGVVSATPGIYGGTQVAIRGIAAGGTALDGSSPISYYLDSVPFGFVRSAYAPDSNAFDLERVEVLRGPQGTLYGASAEAGVVRVLTNDADLTSYDLKARGDASDTDSGGFNYRGDLAANVPLVDGKLAVRSVVDYESLSGWIGRPTETKSNYAELRNYRLKFNAQPTDVLSVALSLWSSRDSYGAPSTSLADRTAPGTGTLHEPNENDFDAYGLKIGYQFSQATLTSSTSYLSYHNGFTLDTTPLGLPGLLLAVDYGSHVLAEEVNLSSRDEGPWRWSAGLFYRDVQDHEIQNFGNIDFIDKSRSYAVFGEVTRRFLDNQLGLTLGLRQFHDDVSSEKGVQTAPTFDASASFDATTPRAVLTWYPSSDFTLYGSFSEGFRSGMPQYYTIAQSDPNLPPLKPDKLYNYEIGTKGDVLDKRVEFDAALYYIDWRDVQQTLSVPYAGGYIGAQVNGQTASGPGFEVSVITRPLDSWNFGADFSWNDLTFDETVYSAGQVLFNKGDRLNFSSQYTAGGFTDYSFPLFAGFAGKFSASANYNSKQTNHAIGLLIKGDQLLMVRASFSVVADHWGVTLYGENLNNAYGATPAEIAVPDWYPRPRPRTAGVTIDYHFK